MKCTLTIEVDESLYPVASNAKAAEEYIERTIREEMFPSRTRDEVKIFFRSLTLLD